MTATARDVLRLDSLRLLEKPQVRNFHFEMFNDGYIKVLLSNTWLAFVHFHVFKRLKTAYSVMESSCSGGGFLLVR